MSRRNPNATACALAAAMLLACVGVMLALSRAEPPKSAEEKRASHREMLDSPREEQGVPCRGYVELDAAGQLKSGILDREHAFGPVTLPVNTQFYLRPDGTVKDVHLGADATYDGHTCLGRGPGEWMTGFHPNGRLAYCFLVAGEAIDGVPCRRGSFWGEITGGVIVSLHDNGRLAACRLAADVTRTGQMFKKGKRITLDPEGNPNKP
ncbi:MAG: hypothetical protein MUC69_10435 [Gemmatimonadales bacterium]|nr:hypothetical protein [Gemmatimonadales bacterium]